MRYVNLTPHSVTLVLDGGKRVNTIPPSGEVARIEYRREHFARLPGDIPVSELTDPVVVGLPKPAMEDGEPVFYITSALVAEHVRRWDVVAPDTGRAIRDGNGRTVGVPGLVRFCCTRIE